PRDRLPLSGGLRSFGNPRGRVLVPEEEAPAERILVRAEPHVLRQLVDELRVAAAEHDVVRLQRGRERGDRSDDILAPALLAAALEGGVADVFLERLLSIRKVAELHRLHETARHECRAEPGAETEEEHRAGTVVAAERLHRGIVHDARRLTERCAEVEADPPAPEVDGIADDAAAVHRRRYADRDDVEAPAGDRRRDALDHLVG